MDTKQRRMSFAAIAAAGLIAGLAACTPIPGTGGDDDAASDAGAAAPSLEQQLGGAWGAATDEPGQPRLEFQDEGVLGGTDGCNGISGTYAVEGETVKLEQAASTLRACEGVDDWLRGATEIRVDGEQLHVLNAEGTEIGQLDRAE